MTSNPFCVILNEDQQEIKLAESTKTYVGMSLMSDEWRWVRRAWSYHS